MTAPRPATERKRDTLARLERDVDVWVATARGDIPHLIPLSFLWDGARLLLATPDSSVTARNLRATGRARLTLGTTRDVVVIEGTAQSLPLAAVPPVTADAAERLRDALPQGELVTVEKAGHGVPSQNTKGFLAALVPWLGRVSK